VSLHTLARCIRPCWGRCVWNSHCWGNVRLPGIHLILVVPPYTGFRLIINLLSIISLTRLAVRARPPQNWGIDADE
jgi:hypothetical protein